MKWWMLLAVGLAVVLLPGSARADLTTDVLLSSGVEVQSDVSGPSAPPYINGGPAYLYTYQIFGIPAFYTGVWSIPAPDPASIFCDPTNHCALAFPDAMLFPQGFPLFGVLPNSLAWGVSPLAASQDATFYVRTQVAPVLEVGYWWEENTGTGAATMLSASIWGPTPPIVPTPEPGSLWFLMATGLVGLFSRLLSRRRFSSPAAR